MLHTRMAYNTLNGECDPVQGKLGSAYAGKLGICACRQVHGSGGTGHGLHEVAGSAIAL